MGCLANHLCEALKFVDGCKTKMVKLKNSYETVGRSFDDKLLSYAGTSTRVILSSYRLILKTVVKSGVEEEDKTRSFRLFRLQRETEKVFVEWSVTCC